MKAVGMGVGVTGGLEAPAALPGAYSLMPAPSITAKLCEQWIVGRAVRSHNSLQLSIYFSLCPSPSSAPKQTNTEIMCEWKSLPAHD